jgi:hypothetical protein
MLSLGMTALPPKADIDRGARHVRFVPLATKHSAAKLCLFDHFVGDRLQHQRHGEMSPSAGAADRGRAPFRRIRTRSADDSPPPDSPSAGELLKTKRDRRQAAFHSIYTKTPHAKRKGVGYNGKTLLADMHLQGATSWRTHLTTATFPHHGETLMLPSTTFGTKGL